MRIDPKDSIGDTPIIAVRDFAQENVRSGFSEPHLRERLSLSRAESEAMICDLMARGWLERDTTKSETSSSWYHFTEGGSRFASALASKPVSRAVARKAVDGLLDRATAIESDESMLYRVEKLILFGSYLGDAPTLGDVDVAVKLKGKFDDIDMQMAKDDAQTTQAEKEGRSFSNLSCRLSWPLDRVRLYLKSRSRVLQFCSSDNPVVTKGPHQVIFENGVAYRI